MSPQTFLLSDLAVGAHALISKMGDDPHLCYLRCMGFCPGAHVELVRRVSGGAMSLCARRRRPSSPSGWKADCQDSVQ
jgi:hypothetical protein